jgi:hypothetical protein
MSIENMHKVKVTAPLHTEAAALASVADILSLPDEASRQPDLQYLTAIFVSSGMNKNGAVFLGSELVKARNSIDSKAVDIEHEEQSIIGQITGNAFLKRDRTMIDVESAATEMSVEELDELEMDIGITAIIHKSRFPEIAKEIEAGQWMVSMEAFYRDYDIKVGDKIIPREKAEELGYDKMVGTVVQVRDGNKEMGFHLVGRVLRDILFAGVGIVQNPANPRSVIMEAAAINEYVEEESKEGNSKVIDLAGLEGVTTETASREDNDERIREVVRDFVLKVIDETMAARIENVPPKSSEEDDAEEKEEAHITDNRSLPGTCVSYARYVYTYPQDMLEDPETDLSQYPKYSQPGLHDSEAPGAEVSREHYCKLFDADCTARPGDATDPNCLRHVFSRTVEEEIASHSEAARMRKIQDDVVKLQDLVASAKKFVK